MTVIVEGRFIDNPWITAALADASAAGPVIVDVQDLLALLGHADAPLPRAAKELGVFVGSDVDAGAMRPLIDSVSLIVIAFPALGDGRGFSLAHALRRFGYIGELRAHGALIADQYAHLRGVGFDSIEVPDELTRRHTELDWLKAWREFPIRYQARTPGLESILERRHSMSARNARTQAAQTKV